MSTETVIEATNWRLVELGRVVLVNRGPSAGKLAVIAEIIDHKRALIDGPTTGVPRQAILLGRVVLTPHVVPKITRGARTKTIAKRFQEAKLIEKWDKSAWANKIHTRKLRSNLSDFDRFKVLVLKKQKRYQVNKALAKN